MNFRPLYIINQLNQITANTVKDVGAQ